MSEPRRDASLTTTASTQTLNTGEVTVDLRRDWRDWLPDGAPEPQLITRDELIEWLADNGINLPTRTLESWHRQGVLPYPVRRKHGETVKALYPTWFITAIKHLRDSQDRGLSLDKIKPLMRMDALNSIQWRDPTDDLKEEARRALTAYARAYVRRWGGGREVGGIIVQITDGLGNPNSTIAEFDFPVVPDADNPS
jgi:DNA-binding transcriptional MerR regulator